MSDNESGEVFSPTVSDESVKAKTGRDWSEWFALLDQSGAAEMSHPAMARYVSEKFGAPDWWCQTIVVNYERARGRRAKHEKADGYQISATKTIGVPAERLYQAWDDGELRRRWLPDQEFTVRRATPPKTMRLSWPDGTLVIVGITARDNQRSQIAVQHEKLPNPEQAEAMKRFWRDAVERLRLILEE
jgi:hypothetical protein